MNDLFTPLNDGFEQIQKDVYLFRALTSAEDLYDDIKSVLEQAPFRFMRTPGGKKLNISVTNCGALGWISDVEGYRYSPLDPTNGKPWPKIPASFLNLAQTVSKATGFTGFRANACLINHYKQGSKLTSHQDKNEQDFSQPIVSISLGMRAVFQIFGDKRSQKAANIELYDGDVMVWGRSARLMYHGVKTIRSEPHPLLADHRINLTLRMA